MAEVKLGHLDLHAAEVSECADCKSRNVVKVRGDVDPEYIKGFVLNRARMLNISVSDYDIHIDKKTGEVTATPKTDLEFDIS